MNARARDNLNSVLDRIARAAVRSSRDPSEIRLVAATKKVSEDRILDLVEAGVQCIGESYVQEARKKKDRLGSRVQWHMIGHVQKNKVKLASRLFDMIETVDDEGLAEALERQAGEEGRVLEVLVQVNLSGEESKSGTTPEGAFPLIEKIHGLKALRCTGLMTLPPVFGEPEEARPYFAALRELRERLIGKGIPEVCLRELSMGMSSDFEVAVEEGATIVRIGTALFGARPGT